MSKNWRLTFGLDGADAIDINLEDYHCARPWEVRRAPERFASIRRIKAREAA